MQHSNVYKLFLLSVLAWLFSGALAQTTAQNATQDGAFESAGVTAIYADADGNLNEIADGDLTAGRFVFYAWLEDLDGGFSLANPATAPSDDEKTEFAPSRTQNLVAAFVGYRDDDGNILPVAGAQVRWEIDEQWDDAIGSTFFGAADAVGQAGVAGGLGITANQAVTLTNNANLFNRARFPVAEDFPLYNATGLTSPDVGGVTWVTLFSPDNRARARVLAVASVNGVEIGKELVVKNFAPRPELRVEKSVTPKSINLVGDEQGTVTFNVTVTNTGSGDATGVTLDDSLTSGNADAYALVDREGDGFTETFDLPAGESRDFSFQAQAGATDTYCNTAAVTEFADEFGQTRNPDLTAQACFEVISPELNIIKDFVDANGESLGDSVTVDAGQTAILRVRVLNQGDGPAENLVVTDDLTSGDAASYRLVQLPEGVTPTGEGDDAFSGDLGTLDAQTAVTLTYTVTADADGEYCDTASYTVGGEPGNQDQACLTVATPELAIQKVNDQDTVLPGNTYTSTITVTNTGNAVARDVVVSDVVGTNTAGDATLVYVSSQVENEAGVFDQAQGTVNAPAAIDLQPEQSVVLTVTTRVPERVAADQFCDVGRYTSANAGEGEVQVCVDVPAFAALQTKMVDDPDPVLAGGNVQYTSTIYVEDRSNEAVTNNQVTFTFGSQEGGQAGSFEITDAQVFVASNPQRNAETGLVVATPSSGQALTADQFSVSGDTAGQQTITLNIDLEPNTAVFFVHTVTVPAGTAAGSYGSSYDWSATGADSGTQYNPQNSEPTTVISQ